MLGYFCIPIIAIGGFYALRSCDKGNIISLSYNDTTESFELVLSDLRSVSITFKRGEYTIERRSDHYLLKDLKLKDSYILYTNKEGIVIDHKLLNELLCSDSDDKALKSILIRDSKLINLNCPYSRLHRNSVDLIAREKIAAQENNFEELTQAEINLKILTVPQTQVQEFVNSLNANLEVQLSDELKKIEDLFIKCGLVEKALQITKFVQEKFFVRKLKHLKGFTDYELNILEAKFKLSKEELSCLKEELLEIR